ncbi:MAG: hypothetical protein JXR96_25085 [Deltaproteobacteria bacterium]|nr:hypothetical protein [Deltaproteobacteria bacterium]
MRGIEIGLLSAALLLAGSLRAESAPKPGALAMETRRVVIFKDGHGLFVKRASGVADAEGKLHTPQVPDAASLGSFWFSDPRARISHVTAREAVEEIRERIDSACENAFEVIKANQGREAEVVTRDGKRHSGRIRAVLETGSGKVPETRAHAYLPVRSSPVLAPAEGASEVLRSPTGSLFVLRTSQGDQLLSVADLAGLRIENMATSVGREKVVTRRVKLLTFEYEKPAPGRKREIDLLYFRPGIRWIPTYRIELDERSKRAELVLQAEVINEAEDFSDTEVDFVVGLPTFRFRDVVSPLVLEKVLRDALAQAAPQLMGQLAANPLGNIQFHSRAGERYRPGPGQGDGESTGVAVEAMEGREVQDLFYYSTRRLGMKRGERAVVELLRARVPFRHLYTWSPKLGQGGPGVQTHGRSPLQLEENEVWHQVVLVNKGDRPWTTGPALLTQAGQPIGQDLLTFTPPGREVMVPMTAAISVRGTVREKELSREAGALRIGGRSYSRVLFEATLSLSNALDRRVRLRVHAAGDGRCTQASHDGRIEHVQPPGLMQRSEALLSMRSEVEWGFDLGAGKSRQLQVRYHRYLRD